MIDGSSLATVSSLRSASDFSMRIILMKLTLLGCEPNDHETDEDIRELFSLDVILSGLMDSEFERILSGLR